MYLPVLFSPVVSTEWRGVCCRCSMSRLSSRAADVDVYPVNCDPPVNPVFDVTAADRPTAVNSLHFSRTSTGVVDYVIIGDTDSV